MQKPGINPITIQPLQTHPGNGVTIGRIHIGTGSGIGVGRAVPKSTHLANPMKMLTIAVFDKTKCDAAQAAGEKPEIHAATLDEDGFLDALGHLFPNGELALTHLGGDAEMLKQMLDTWRALSNMKLDGEGADPDDEDDEGYVMENDDCQQTLSGLIEEARGYVERLGK